MVAAINADIDVAPEYGDGVAQARLGPAIGALTATERKSVFLACKTMFRDRASAKRELAQSLQCCETEVALSHMCQQLQS